MAGAAIVMLRMVRLKPAITATINSMEFVRLKIVPGLCKVLKSDKMWTDMSTILRAVYPALLLLRLSDKKQPGMDKLYYYVRRMDDTMKRSKELLDKMEASYKGGSALKYYLQSSDDDYNIYNNEVKKEANVDDDNDDSSVEELVGEGGTSGEDCISDDDEASDVSVAILDASPLGTKVFLRWELRKKKLVTDLFMTGWMLSPSSEVMEDYFVNHDGSHRNALEQVLKKWILVKDETIGDNINLFWEEFDQFVTKTGLFGNRELIWNSSDFKSGNAHMWHYRNSLQYTKLFGKLACRVTSKILGIGLAERSWGDVKHLKTNKRAHLSAFKVKKQATIFGASCMERADIERLHVQETKSPYKFWTDKDFDAEFDMLVENVTPRKNIRLFSSWKDDREDEAMFSKDAVSDQQTFYSDPNNVRWSRVGKTKKGKRTGGYCLISYDEAYNKEDDKTNDDHIENWVFSDDLRWSISTYYENHPELNVHVLELDETETTPSQPETAISQLSDESDNEK